MPITISGSGTVTGISAGGLPDDCITTAEIAAAAVTTAKLGSSEASGLAKAWVNFNGTGTVAIRASYNVSSITDSGTGDYTVNFTTAMVDANYVTQLTNGFLGGTGEDWVFMCEFSNKLTTSVHFKVVNYLASAYVDSNSINVAIFR